MRVLLFLLACGFAGSGDLRADLERVCKVAERIEDDTSIDPSKKLTKLVKRAVEERAGSAGIALLRALEAVPPSARRKILDEALQRNGLQDLDCPALERIIVK